jgi:Rrf2 family transcriptional regulator, iron-sulfur cluster assembly transcription factor
MVHVDGYGKGMRLELGRRADYAIRAVVDLAHHSGGGERRTSRAIADEMAIPASYIPQILAELVRAGLVDSVAGRSGGYVLARAPSDISLLDVVHATESAVVSTACVLRGGPCRWEEMCAVHVPWAEAQHALLDSLGSTSLADVVAIDEGLAAGTYEVPYELVQARASSTTRPEVS